MGRVKPYVRNARHRAQSIEMPWVNTVNSRRIRKDGRNRESTPEESRFT